MAGDGTRDYAVVRVFDSGAALDRDAGFSEEFEEVHGEGSCLRPLMEVEEAIARGETELHELIPELSAPCPRPRASSADDLAHAPESWTPSRGVLGAWVGPVDDLRLAAGTCRYASLEARVSNGGDGIPERAILPGTRVPSTGPK